MSALDENSRPALAPQVRLQRDPATGDQVLLFPEGITVLNETAHEIAARCDGRQTVAEITGTLAREFEVAEDELRDDVLECLRELEERKLIVLR